MCQGYHHLVELLFNVPKQLIMATEEGPRDQNILQETYASFFATKSSMTYYISILCTYSCVKNNETGKKGSIDVTHFPLKS